MLDEQQEKDDWKDDKTQVWLTADSWARRYFQGLLHLKCPFRCPSHPREEAGPGFICIMLCKTNLLDSLEHLLQEGKHCLILLCCLFSLFSPLFGLCHPFLLHQRQLSFLKLRYPKLPAEMPLTFSNLNSTSLSFVFCVNISFSR